MKNNLVTSAPHITLNVECLYRSSIKHAYFSGIPNWDVSKINSCLTLPNASAKSIKTTINLVLLCRKSSISAFNEYEFFPYSVFGEKLFAKTV